MFKIQFNYKGKWINAKKAGTGYNSYEEASEAMDKLIRNIKLLDQSLGLIKRSSALRIINTTCKVKFLTPDPVVRLEAI